MDYRMDKDSIGELQIPKEAYYGAHSLRAKQNFPITGLHTDPEIIKAAVEIKKACAITNNEVGLMEDKKAQAIIKACDKILEGGFEKEFIVDPVQGGAGTSHNMNTNEVVANVAIEILGGELGDYSIIHPNDDVNFGQSTNDVYPTSGKIAIIRYLKVVKEELHKLIESTGKKAEEFDQFIKMGRTQMQDAIPIRLGQEFAAYKKAMERDEKRLDLAIETLSLVNMGATAIGTGLNADENYVKKIVPNLCKVTGLDLKQTEDLVDGTQNLDCFAFVSGILKTMATSLSKIANDMRLMSSGPKTGFGEIILPAKQAGSSIMPGKVNPVIAEVLNQASFITIGNDMTINMCVEAGQLELNAFEATIFYKMFESLKALKGAMYTFRINLMDGIIADEERMKYLVEHSIGIVTALAPHIGYEKSASAAKESLKTGVPIREIILQKKYVSEEDLNRILDLYAMTSPGIVAEDLLLKD